MENNEIFVLAPFEPTPRSTRDSVERLDITLLKNISVPVHITNFYELSDHDLVLLLDGGLSWANTERNQLGSFLRTVVNSLPL
jgi:hypothetical protein